MQLNDDFEVIDETGDIFYFGYTDSRYKDQFLRNYWQQPIL